MFSTLPTSWQTALAAEFTKTYCQALNTFVQHAYASETVYPPYHLLFEAFRLTPFDRVRVVLIGQDPYHEPNQAQGLAFYVPPSTPTPPSLRNITKELATEYPTSSPRTIPNLLSWAEQGVLLLNTTLTVRAGEAGSHQKHGWETFTDAVISTLNTTHKNLVFLLWGKPAQQKEKLLNPQLHLILKAAHPSPLSASRGFFGCNHFRLTNDYLTSHGLPPIKW